MLIQEITHTDVYDEYSKFFDKGVQKIIQNENVVMLAQYNKKMPDLPGQYRRHVAPAMYFSAKIDIKDGTFESQIIEFVKAVNKIYRFCRQRKYLISAMKSLMLVDIHDPDIKIIASYVHLDPHDVPLVTYNNMSRILPNSIVEGAIPGNLKDFVAGCVNYKKIFIIKNGMSITLSRLGFYNFI